MWHKSNKGIFLLIICLLLFGITMSDIGQFVKAENDEPVYVLATNDDFMGLVHGFFSYIGSDEYVEIPHTIKGVNITSYNSMFLGASVKGVKSTNKNITDMSNMFKGSQATTLDLSSFDTSNVTDMSNMFEGSQATELDLSNFDTSSVTDVNSMFYLSQATKGYARTQADADKFNASNYKPSRLEFEVFRGTPDNYKLATDDDFSGSANGEFRYIGDDEYVEIPHVIKGVNVTSYYRMFSDDYGAKTSNVKSVKSTNVNVVNMSYMFYRSPATELDLSSLDTSNVTTMYDMFNGIRAKKLNLSSFDTSNVTDMSYMFSYSEATELDLSNFDTSNVTNMISMFLNSQATELDLSSFGTRNVTNMSHMFRGSRATELDLSDFDTSNVTTMTSMFSGSQATELDLSGFETSNVTTMSSMFYNNQATKLDLSSFNTSNVTDMSSMFYNNQATELDVSSFNTSSVASMRRMFYRSQATKLDLSSFDTSNVMDMNFMFDGSQSAKGYARTQNDADNFNSSSFKPSDLTFKVKDADGYVLATDDDFDGNADGYFRYVGNDEYVEIPHVIKGVNVTSYSRMFSDWFGAKTLNVKGVKSTNSNITDVSAMFMDSKTTTLNLGSFDTGSVTDMSSMFENSQATLLDLSSFDTSSVTDVNSMFYLSQATKGYARTQVDADKFNNSLNKPSELIFITVVPDITFVTNGNDTDEPSQSTVVNVDDKDINLTALKYQWTTSPTFPTDGTWIDFNIGDTILINEGTGDYYLHITATNERNITTEATSNVFRLGNTVPPSEIIPEPEGDKGESNLVVDKPFLGPKSPYYVVSLPISLNSTKSIKPTLHYKVYGDDKLLMSEEKDASVAPTASNLPLPRKGETIEENKDYTKKDDDRKESKNSIASKEVTNTANFTLLMSVIAIISIIIILVIVVKRRVRKRI